MCITEGKIFAVIGDDARQIAAGEYLKSKGLSVVETENLYKADYILLPMPLTGDCSGFVQLLKAAKPGALAFGGKVSAQAFEAAKSAGIRLYDYLLREDLALLNAIPTAEGCLSLIFQNRRQTLWHSSVLILGYGRCARALAVRLAALYADVTIAARSPAQRAQALCSGLHAVPLQNLTGVLSRAQVVINTIPAPVLDASHLSCLSPESLIIDLASLPGGTDFDAAKKLGLSAIHALSLPARCAPITAGEFVARAVLSMLDERGEIYD